MAIALPDARQLSDEVLQALRVRALRGWELGFSETDLADLLGISRESICRWCAAYRDGELDALPGDRTGRPRGTGRLLSEEQSQHLQQQIDHHLPEDVGIASPLWTRWAVRDLIRQEYGLELPVRTVGEYLKRWGYTAKRPRRRARRQDSEEVREWLEKTYPALEQRAATEGAEILWADETGVAADEHLGEGYARRGAAATMEVPDPHIRMNQIAAISNTGTVRFMTYQGTMNAALYLVFLERLLRSTTGKVFLIVDRLRAHKTPAVKAWIAAHAERLEVFALPRYAPELNPEEYLNHDLKENVHAAGLPHDRSELRSGMQAFMRRLLHLPEHVMSYFSHPCVQYAAELSV